MILFAILVALETAALVLAARRFGWRAPLTVVLAYALVDEVAVESLHRFLFTDPDHPLLVAIERFGWPAQGLYHVESAVIIGWSALLAGAAWRVFAGNRGPARDFTATSRLNGGCSTDTRNAALPSYARRSDLDTSYRGRSTVATWRRVVEYLFGAWLIAAGGLAATFPLPRGWTAPLLHGVELAFVVAAMAALPAGWRSRALARREGKALAVLLVGELTNALIGAWALGNGVYGAWNTVARAGYLVVWIALLAILARR